MYHGVRKWPARPAIVRPQLAVAEAHAVERLPRQAGAVVGELLGIGEGAAQPLDFAGLAADVPGRAQMAGRRGAAHRDPRTRREAGRQRLRRLAHGAACRASISAILRPSSSAVKPPRCSSLLATAEIQRSY